MGRSPALAALFVVAACGFRIESGMAVDGGRDSPGGDGSGPDSSIDGPMPMMATRIDILASSSEDDDPSATGDLLELYFNSGRAGGLGGGDIYVTTRATKLSPWTTPVNVPNVNTSSNEGPPEISADGLTLMFSSDRGGGLGGHDIYIATRLDRNAQFTTPAHLSMLSSSSSDIAPVVLSDNLRLVMTSSRAPTNDDLWLSTRLQTSDSWNPPTLIAELATTMKDGNATITADGNLILFGSDRPGSMSEDLWRATRNNSSGVFGTPQRIDSLSSSGIDTDPWISPDGSTIFFASNRDSGNLDLYEATAP